MILTLFLQKEDFASPVITSLSSRIMTLRFCDTALA